MGGQIQVISGDGAFAGDAVETFLKDHVVSNAGVGYTTVAIMGPQSSGKSTMLNAVVRFRFQLETPRRCVSEWKVMHWSCSPFSARSIVYVLHLKGINKSLQAFQSSLQLACLLCCHTL